MTIRALKSLGLSVLLAFILAQAQAKVLPALKPADNSAMIQALRERLLHVKTLQGDIEFSGNKSFHGKSVRFLTSGGKLYADLPSRLRLDMTAQVANSDPVKTDIYREDNILWFKISASPHDADGPPFVGRLDLARVGKKFPQIMSQGFNNPAFDLMALDALHVKVLGKTQVDQVPVYILEGAMNPDFSRSLPFEFGKAAGSKNLRLWVGIENGITYQAIMADKNGQEIGGMRLANVVIDGQISSDVFQFSLPVGVTPVDMTPLLEKTEIIKWKNQKS